MTSQNEVLKGSYVLLLSLEKGCEIAIGAMGNKKFQPGIYFYCGSAMNGIDNRVGRHFRTEKKLRWHIDFLLQRAELLGALVFPQDNVTECLLCSSLSKAGPLKFPVKGFGSSDCSCQSHLLYLEDENVLSVILFNLETSLIS